MVGVYWHLVNFSSLPCFFVCCFQEQQTQSFLSLLSFKKRSFLIYALTSSRLFSWKFTGFGLPKPAFLRPKKHKNNRFQWKRTLHFDFNLFGLKLYRAPPFPRSAFQTQEWILSQNPISLMAHIRSPLAPPQEAPPYRLSPSPVRAPLPLRAEN